MDGSSWFKQAAFAARSGALGLQMVVLGALVFGCAACAGPISDFPFGSDDEAPGAAGDGDSTGGPGGDNGEFPSMEQPDRDAGMDAGVDSSISQTGPDDAGCGAEDAGAEDGGAEDGGMPPCEQRDASSDEVGEQP